jgi:hypothetical protein
MSGPQDKAETTEEKVDSAMRNWLTKNLRLRAVGQAVLLEVQHPRAGWSPISRVDLTTGETHYPRSHF